MGCRTTGLNTVGAPRPLLDTPLPPRRPRDGAGPAVALLHLAAVVPPGATPAPIRRPPSRSALRSAAQPAPQGPESWPGPAVSGGAPLDGTPGFLSPCARPTRRGAAGSRPHVGSGPPRRCLRAPRGSDPSSQGWPSLLLRRPPKAGRCPPNLGEGGGGSHPRHPLLPGTYPFDLLKVSPHI